LPLAALAKEHLQLAVLHSVVARTRQNQSISRRDGHET